MGSDEGAASALAHLDALKAKTRGSAQSIKPLIVWAALSYGAGLVCWLTEKDHTILTLGGRRFVLDYPAVNSFAFSIYWGLAVLFGVVLTVRYERRRLVVPATAPTTSTPTNPVVGFVFALFAVSWGLGILIGYERHLARNGVGLMLPIAIAVVLLGRLYHDQALERGAAWALVPMAASAPVAGARGGIVATAIYGTALLVTAGIVQFKASR